MTCARCEVSVKISVLVLQFIRSNLSIGYHFEPNLQHKMEVDLRSEPDLWSADRFYRPPGHVT